MATASTSKSRTSTIPPPPKPPTSLSSSLTIADNASMVGSHLITIGYNTVIHPRTKLVSTYGPLTVGSNCILSERSIIGLQSASSTGVTIDVGVVIEVGAVVEAERVGEGCVIEINARIGKGAILGKHCKIGPLCEVAEGEIVPDFTVIYGHGMRRIDKGGVEHLKLKMVGRHVDVLKKLIPSNVAKFQ